MPKPEISEVSRFPSMNPPTRPNTSSVSSSARTRLLRGMSESHMLLHPGEGDEEVDGQGDDADRRHTEGEQELARSEHTADGDLQL